MITPRSREQLELEIKAGEAAERLLDQLVTVRRRITGVAEDLYMEAWAALEHASSDLAAFDRQSQGALDESRARIREASRRLFTHSCTDATAKPGEPDRDVRRLEQEHRDAHAAEVRLLEELKRGRAPIEERYRVSARDVLLAGQVLTTSLEADRSKLAAAVDRGRLASMSELVRGEDGKQYVRLDFEPESLGYSGLFGPGHALDHDRPGVNY